jgi:hypothetical protein
MTKGIDAYLEVGTKRVFAGALDWPGWSRSGRDADAALQALVDYAPRYAAAMGTAAKGLPRPKDPSGLKVVERLRGSSGTDFGAPSSEPAADKQPLNAAGLRGQIALLKASWSAFSRSAKAANGLELRKGPRGGGRDLDHIVRHVAEAEASYLYRLGGKYQDGGLGDQEAEMKRLRAEILDMLMLRVEGTPFPPSKRTAPLWTPRYFVRRTAWHALDHAWEIEDRAIRD